MPNTYNDLFKQSGVRKRLVVSFPSLSVTLGDSDMVENSMVLEESICSEDTLLFGCCEASVFKLRIIGNSIVPLIGATCNVSMIVGDIAEPYVLGTYKVTADTQTADRKYRDIVAYDAMYDILNADVASWYNGLTFPIQLSAFRNSFFSHLGITQQSTTLVNDSISISKTINASKIAGKAVIAAICEINGVFGHIGRNGSFQYKSLDSSSTSIDYSLVSQWKYEDFQTKKIGKLQIRSEEGDVGVSVGSGANTYVIEGNFLLYGKGTDELTPIAQNVFDAIKDVYYRPSDMVCVGNPCTEVGCLYETTISTKTIRSYVLTRTLKGIQSLQDSFSSPGTEEYSEEVNGIRNELIQLANKSNVLKRTIEGTESRITDLTAATTGSGSTSLQSQINQNASQISLKVSNDTFETTVDELQQQIDNSIVTYNLDHTPALDNFPAYDWCETPILDVSLFDANGEIPWTYTDDSYNDHSRTMAYDETSGVTYRFGRGNTGWEWTAVPNSEFGVISSRVSALEISVDEITSTVENEYLRIDDASDTYATQMLLTSSIEQSATSITSSVSANYQTKSDASSDLEAAKTYADAVGDASIVAANSSIQQSATSILSTVSATYQTLSGASTEYTTLSSEIAQKPDNISLTIANDATNTRAGITIGWTEDGTSHSAQGTINLTGLVSFTSLSTSGSTTINGDNITTGKLNASLIKTGALEIKQSGNTLFKADASNSSVSIGGFTVTPSSIYRGTSSIDSTSAGVYVGTDGFSNYKDSSNYARITNGVLTCKGADIYGKITAVSGSIGGIDIKNNYISSGITSPSGTGMYLSGSDFYIGNSSKYLKATSNGTLQVKGDITADSGSIGGFTISSYSIYNNKSSISSSNSGVYIGTDGISVGSGSICKMTSDGQLSCSNLNATGGTIGGFTIGSSKLYNNKSSLTSYQSSGVYVGTDGLGVGGSYLSDSELNIRPYGINYAIKIAASISSLRTEGSIQYGTEDKIIFRPNSSSNNTWYHGNVTIGSGSCRLGFFGISGDQKRTVNRVINTTSAQACANTINALLTALSNYGLITMS